MRVDELRAREDFDAVLAATLARGWSVQHGRRFDVARGGGGGQRFRLQPILSAYYSDGVSSRARRYLRDSFRYTSRRSRILPQYLLGTAIGSKAGLALLGSEGFEVSPALPHAEDLLVVPGNQRVRLFDFSKGRSRVLQKAGFASDSMRRELEFRAAAADLAVPLLDHNLADGWFEEPIFDGYVLARCPPWISRSQLVCRALAAVDVFVERTRRSLPTYQHVGVLLEGIRASIALISDKFPVTQMSGVSRLVDALVARALADASVEVALVHGDFQSGNVLLSRDGQKVKLIDWEHGRERLAFYDRLVWGLQSRSPFGLAARLRKFLDGWESPAFAPLPKTTRARKTLLATFLLEDLTFYAHECCTGPYRAPSKGLLLYLEELKRLGPGLRELFGELR